MEEEPLLLPTDTVPTLHWRGIDFYPRSDPLGYARRKARAALPPPRSLCFVPSLGLGYGLADLLDALPEDCAVLCVEAFQQVMAVASRQPMPQDPRLVIVRTEDPAAAVEVLRGMGTGRFRRVVRVPLCSGYRLSAEAYRRMLRDLELEILRYWQNRLTMIAMGSLQVRNLLANLTLLRQALDFSALSSTLPVVVAGAGPSLEPLLALLARQRPRFALLAVDTAFSTLRAAGLQPDLVIAIEAQAANNQDFIPAPGPEAPLLACDLSVHPSAARLFPQRLAFFSSEFAPLRLWQRLERHGLRPTAFPALGSVGVTAVHAALRLTDNLVFLVGLDFGYPGHRTHARGSPPHVAMLSRSDRFFPPGQGSYGALAERQLQTMADKAGRLIPTDRVMRSYRDGLEAEIRADLDRVYDGGSSGLALGAEAIPFERFERMLQASPALPDRVRVSRQRRFRGDLRAFLADERALLARFLRAAEVPDPADSGGELEELLGELDYAWAHFPDRPGPSTPLPGFLARARVAARYYDERLERVESVL